MKSHITEEQLIQWLFDLADAHEARAIGDHVASCDACTALKTQVEHKFAQLDMLQGDPVVSDALVQKTRANCEDVPVKRVNLWWVSVAACLVLAGLISVKTMNWPDKVSEQTDEIAPGVVADSPPLAPSSEAPRMLAKDAPAPTMMARLRPDSNADDPSTGDPFARRPFAPASAIELVTLPVRENVQVTIYNEEDLTLVREQRKLILKRGWNWLQFMWANTKIDPTSLDLEPKQDQDRVTVEQLVYPAGLKEIGRWLIRSEVDGLVPFELTYFTSGLTWRAAYMGTLSQDETSMALKSYVRVDNRSGEDFDKTQVRLVLGDVQMLEPIAQLADQAYAFGRPDQATDKLYFGASEELRRTWGESPVVMDDSFAAFGRAELDRKDVAKKALSEYMLYTIEGTEDLKDQWGKRLLSFEGAEIPVESLYKYDEGRWGTQAIRFVSFANDTEHELGQTAMPQGSIRLFGQDDQDGLTFVGNSEFKYIPVGQDVTLNMGPARYVKVEPTLMSVETTGHAFDPNGNLVGWNQTSQWQIEVTNTRSVPVKVEITRALDTEKWTMDQHSDAMAYEKYDTREARFTLTLAPKDQRKETYTVTTYHGTNEQRISNIQHGKRRLPWLNLAAAAASFRSPGISNDQGTNN